MRTTSQGLWKGLHGRKCNHQHVHQPLEGQVWVKGKRINRTELSEKYPRKMARFLARNLTQQLIHKEHVRPKECAYPAVDVTTTPKPSKMARVTRAKSARPPAAELVDPTALTVKRRRLFAKGPDHSHMEEGRPSYQDIVKRILLGLPRVGKSKIDQPDIIRDLQILFPEKKIIGILACKGTERDTWSQHPKAMQKKHHFEEP